MKKGACSGLQCNEIGQCLGLQCNEVGAPFMIRIVRH